MENEVSGVLGEQAPSVPGSSSLRNLIMQPSRGQGAINLTMPRASGPSCTDKTRQDSMTRPSSKDRQDGSIDMGVDGPSVPQRGCKRQRDWAPGFRRHRSSQGSSSESPLSQRSKRSHEVGYARARLARGPPPSISMSESSVDELDNDTDESSDDDSGSLDSGFQAGV